MRTAVRVFVVSTGGYRRAVVAKNADRAVTVFFLKEQPQVVGFAICVREKKAVGYDNTRYAHTPSIVGRLFPDLACVPGPTANSFRVIPKEKKVAKEQRN